MKHRLTAASAALLSAVVLAGCATVAPDPNYSPIPPALREQPTGSRIARVKKPVTKDEAGRAQDDARSMYEGMKADGLSNQPR
jgi:hypothetical protein